LARIYTGPISLNAATCEALSSGRKRSIFAPPVSDPFKPFPVLDPFGLRRAIVPVFHTSKNSALIGMGTAFHIDGTGVFLTAHHVIEALTSNNATIGSRDRAMGDRKSPHGILVMPFGLVYGTTRLPDEKLRQIIRTKSPYISPEDPIAEMQGRLAVSTIDICRLDIGLPIPETIESLPVRLKGWRPELGEIVMAIGFPELDCKVTERSSLVATLSEGMHAAFGRIVGTYASGRSRTNRTPVFEVEANWPGGMSGGPVLNMAGEVIGIVSSSILANNPALENGAGYAAWFEAMQLDTLLPELDANIPCRRLG
jgi:serine protease Do